MSTESLDRFLLLVNEIGAPLELDPAYSLDDDPHGKRWELILGRGLSLVFTYIENKQSMLISASLGEPVSEAHYKTLLVYNGLYEQTGGIRFGMTHPLGEVVMNLEAALDELSIDQLRGIVFNLTAAAIEWRELILSEPGDVEPPQNPASHMGVRV